MGWTIKISGPESPFEKCQRHLEDKFGVILPGQQQKQPLDGHDRGAMASSCVHADTSPIPFYSPDNYLVSAEKEYLGHYRTQAELRRKSDQESERAVKEAIAAVQNLPQKLSEGLEGLKGLGDSLLAFFEESPFYFDQTMDTLVSLLDYFDEDPIAVRGPLAHPPSQNLSSNRR